MILTHPPSAPACLIKERFMRNGVCKETVEGESPFFPATCSPPGSRQERWREMRTQPATASVTSVKRDVHKKWEI